MSDPVVISLADPPPDAFALGIVNPLDPFLEAVSRRLAETERLRKELLITRRMLALAVGQLRCAVGVLVIGDGEMEDLRAGTFELVFIRNESHAQTVVEVLGR